MHSQLTTQIQMPGQRPAIIQLNKNHSRNNRCFMVTKQTGMLICTVTSKKHLGRPEVVNSSKSPHWVVNRVLGEITTCNIAVF